MAITAMATTIAMTTIVADATHAIAAARIASRELGFEVVGLGSYSREQARAVRLTQQVEQLRLESELLEQPNRN